MSGVKKYFTSTMNYLIYKKYNAYEKNKNIQFYILQVL